MIKKRNIVITEDFDLKELACILSQIIVEYGNRMDELVLIPGKIEFTEYFCEEEDMDKLFGKKWGI